ncbi:hypothetical protein D3C75_687550 [compost metagenome]
MIQAAEVDQGFVGQDQLVQGDIRGHLQAPGLCLGDQFHAAGTGELAEVRAHAGLFNQQQIPGQGDGFGAFRDAWQAKETGGRAFVSQAAFGQVVILGVENHRQVERCRVVQCPAQGAGVAETLQAVAEGHATGIAQCYELCQLFTVQAFAQGANREDFGVAGLTGAVEDQFGHRRGVQHRFGLWRAAQAGHAASRRRAGFADNRAFAAVTRLAQGNVEVDQAGSGHQAFGVNRVDGDKTGWRRAKGDDFAGFNVDIGHLIQAAGRIDHAGAENAELHWAFSCSNWPCSNWRCAVCPLMAMDSTAIRMAIP